ncbi:hypothetical protein SLEP1_g28040 [Rubroshorea leprosula]|uniref:PLAT domain-containing protein n=1 Tax=Rubroshorea leprosula TaxID=152421 RepID=A0AAV5K3T3_9ROSI|nr:hypothetical protein SLEP1_g28040 [Rubroshorea leprosula]
MKALYFSFILLALFFSLAASDYSEDCVYTIYVKTASVIKGGTDSKISLVLGDPWGNSVWIPNLKSWGLMDPNHDYFERGNLDVFSGRGVCIEPPACRLNLTSDGSGPHHGWYVEYMQVTSTGPYRSCSQTVFYVDRWLATDVPPYELTVVLDKCDMWDESPEHGINAAFEVGNNAGRSTASA